MMDGLDDCLYLGECVFFDCTPYPFALLHIGDPLGNRV